MSHPSRNALPQVAYGEGPEVYQTYTHQQEPSQIDQSSPRKLARSSKILGLRRKTFWLGLILIAVVIAAALGGGIGAPHALQKTKSVVPGNVIRCHKADV